MNRTVYLVRHGSHDEVGRVLSGRSEIGLNGDGVAQAAALVKALEHVPIASVHSSPRARTMQTARPIAEHHRLPVLPAPALDEIDFGRFTGRGFAQLEEDADWRRWNAERGTARCPGGETMAEVVARAADYLRGIAADAAPALCVTHCDVIRGLVAAAMGHPMDRVWELPCDPGSLTEIAIDGDAMPVVALNRVPDRPA